MKSLIRSITEAMAQPSSSWSGTLYQADYEGEDEVIEEVTHPSFEEVYSHLKEICNTFGDNEIKEDFIENDIFAYDVYFHRGEDLHIIIKKSN